MIFDAKLRMAHCAAILALLASFPVAAQTAAVGETAGQRYKNVQVLKDIPADELVPAMNFIRGALGVECEFCHVASGPFPQGYEQDNKKEKQTAREMMKMMKRINDTSFAGRTEVTCATCHNGSTRPQSFTPVVTAQTAGARAARAASLPAPGGQASAAADIAKLPTAGELFTKYDQAIGGDTAISRLVSRHIIATVAAAGGQAVKLEGFYKAPDIFVQQSGARSTGYNGSQAWFSAPNIGSHVLTGLDAEDINLAGSFYRNLRPKDSYSHADTLRMDRIGDKDVYVVRAAVKGGRYSDLLYFETDSGLLLRRTTFTRTELGQTAQTTDFENYQEVNGVKWAMDATQSTPWAAPRKVHFDQVQFNVPLEDTKFVMPSPPPAK